MVLSPFFVQSQYLMNSHLTWLFLAGASQVSKHQVAAYLVAARRHSPGTPQGPVRLAEFASSKTIGSFCLCSLDVLPLSQGPSARPWVVRGSGPLVRTFECFKDWMEPFMVDCRHLRLVENASGSRSLPAPNSAAEAACHCPHPQVYLPAETTLIPTYLLRRLALNSLDTPGLSWIRPTSVNKTSQHTSLERQSWSLTRCCQATQATSSSVGATYESQRKSSCGLIAETLSRRLGLSGSFRILWGVKQGENMLWLWFSLMETQEL